MVCALVEVLDAELCDSVGRGCLSIAAIDSGDESIPGLCLLGLSRSILVLRIPSISSCKDNEELREEDDLVVRDALVSRKPAVDGGDSCVGRMLSGASLGMLDLRACLCCMPSATDLKSDASMFVKVECGPLNEFSERRPAYARVTGRLGEEDCDSTEISGTLIPVEDRYGVGLRL